MALAGLIAAAGTGLLLLARGLPLVLVSGCVIGLATGIFMAVNWALGTDLAPAAQAGKYLGISNLAGGARGSSARASVGRWLMRSMRCGPGWVTW